MKLSLLLNSLVFGLILAVGGTGCHSKRPDPRVTKIPGSMARTPLADSSASGPKGTRDLGPGATENAGPTPTPVPTAIDASKGIGQEGDSEFPNMTQDATMFKSNTVFFEFDSPTIKAKERSKIEEVGAYLKSSAGAGHKMLVEGHCDERGTEEYNRALGERRALAIREYLVRLGIAPDRVFTRTYGEDKPAVQGHDEAAWSRNRRSEFVVLKPK